MAAFQEGIERVGRVRGQDGKLKTKELLDVCREVVVIVEKLGTGFALVKSDVGGNIDRLATRAATNPAAYEPDIFQMVRDDVAAGSHMGSSSVTKGLLWLKRAMEFVVALLVKLAEDKGMSVSTAASESYYATLQKFHGWIVTTTFTVALKLVPSRETFFANLGADGQDDATLQLMRQFCDAFSGLLGEVQQFLASNDLDDPTKV
ncbi:hypothetical protein N2152v2_005241 [Parachlorella kessleri]